jgi:hypothetical protein
LQIFTALSCELVKYGDTGATAGIWFLGISGECDVDSFETDDGLVAGARSTLIMSMLAGAAAGTMVTFEWLCCEVCCAGCLEGLCYMAAWVLGSATFMFYGSEFCVDPSSLLEEITGDEISCEYTESSTYLTISIILYLGCGILLCW